MTKPPGTSFPWEHPEAEHLHPTPPPGVAGATAAGGAPPAPARPARPADPADVLPRYEVNVLVVDADGVSRRFVELMLGRETGWQIESAKDAMGALEILRTNIVDVILSERDLPDMTGLQLHERLRHEGRLRSIPFMFLSADTRVATRVVAFQSGADDYLTKPCEPAELVARIVAQVRRSRRAREALLNRGYVLAGDLSVMAFPDLVGTLEMQRRTGMLAVSTERAGAELFFDQGRVVHAIYANLTGAEAFYRLMAVSGGQFEFSPGPCDVEPSERTVRDPVSWLIMEGARRLDMENAKPKNHDPTALQLEQAALVPRISPRHPSQVVPPARSLSRTFILGIEDGFALGQLRLYSYSELAQWTRSPGGRDRLHVHLVAELSAGISGLLAMAAPPNERDILAGLAPVDKAIGLSFFLRNERLVDVLLMDVSRPGAFQKQLLRPPTLTLIAPPRGDFLSVGTRARVELDALLTQLPPQLVLGIGSASLRVQMAELPAIRNRQLPFWHSPGALGEGGVDLRAVLVQALLLWGQRGEGGGPVVGTSE